MSAPAISAAARARFAAWDEALFLARVAELEARLGGPAPAALLELLAEAEGLGLLAEDRMLAHALLVAAPRDLAQLPPERHLSHLAELFNIGEALREEPAWLERVLLDRARREDTPLEARTFARWLAELERAPPPSAWKGPFAVRLVDTRPADAEFLPGPMGLLAPSVVQIRDRRRPVDLVLALGAPHRLYGPLSGLAPPSAGTPARLEGGTLRIGRGKLALPHLTDPEASLAVEAGFVIVSAVDSQRLWIAESA